MRFRLARSLLPLLLHVLLLPAAAARADVAVARDGSVLRRRTLQVRAADGVVVAGEKEYPLRAYYLVERDDGTLLWAADFTARLRGYEFLARVLEREEAVRLAGEAVRARDARLARVLFERAQRCGHGGSGAQKLEERVADLEKRGSLSATPRAAQVRAAAAGLDTLHAELLVVRARRAMGEGDSGLSILRRALAIAPELKSARALLAEVAPARFPLGDPAVWLAWRLEVEARGGEFVADDDEALVKARHFWRKDLYGVRAGPVRLVTPVTDCQSVGRLLAVGLLTDRALAELFGGFPVRREHPRVLDILLFPGREEYLGVSGTMRGYENPASLEWTAGHYSPSEGISRFYWRTDRDAERRLLGTCVHELTHHWLRERNPAYALAEIRRRVDTPGFWIVEGFATLMEEGVFDIDRGEWQLFNERSRSLDVVQALRRRKDALLPWSRFYGMSQADFLRLDHEARVSFARRWSLGFSKIPRSRIFYEQGAATCQYLYHAEEGRRRRQLLQFVVDYYRGQTGRLAPEAAFGLGGEELGERVVRFAVRVAEGWRPAK